MTLSEPGLASMLVGFWLVRHAFTGVVRVMSRYITLGVLPQGGQVEVGLGCPDFAMWIATALPVPLSGTDEVGGSYEGIGIRLVGLRVTTGLANISLGEDMLGNSASDHIRSFFTTQGGMYP
jgi:hypothetical protein